jgi:hypothetical protein
VSWRFLLQTVVHLKPTEALIAKILFSNEGQGLTSFDLAAMAHKARNTINQNIPMTLINQGIIEAHRRGNTYVYRACLLPYLHSTFKGKEKALQAHIFVLL